MKTLLLLTVLSSTSCVVVVVVPDRPVAEVDDGLKLEAVPPTTTPEFRGTTGMHSDLPLITPSMPLYMSCSRLVCDDASSHCRIEDAACDGDAQ